MSESNETLLAQLRALQAQMSAQKPVGMAPPPGMPMMPMQASPAQTSDGMSAEALLVPVSISTPAGEVTVQLQFGAAAAADPLRIVQMLMQAGWPVKAWMRQQPGGGGGGGGFGRSPGGGGGWGGGGGGQPGGGNGWGRKW